MSLFTTVKARFDYFLIGALAVLLAFIAVLGYTPPEYRAVGAGIAENTAGKILLQVEQNGEAWWVNPESHRRYFLGRPQDAFNVMRAQGLGISNENLEKIPIGLEALSGDDTDGDGLSDLFEDAIGSDTTKTDTDGDSFDDKTEVLGGYNPAGSGMARTESSFTTKLKGKILLQVEQNGEAWYVNPADEKRYFLGRPQDAFNVMRALGLGITDVNLNQIGIDQDSALPSYEAPSSGQSEVRITSPEVGALFTPGVQVMVMVEQVLGDEAFEHIVFTTSFGYSSEDTTAPYEFTTTLPNTEGEWVLMVTAYGADNSQSTHSITVNTRN